MKHPDRFEKIVEQHSWMLWARGSQRERDRAVASLLRRQHRAYVRIVKRQPSNGIWIEQDTLLAALDRYKKGVP